MDDERHDYWLRYVRVIADLLHLKDWQIELYRDHPDDLNAAASMLCYYQRKIVKIKLSSWFHTYSPEEQRHFITHELVHVHLDAIDTHMTDAGTVLDSDAYRLLKTTVDRDCELAVDGITDALAPFLPFPGALDEN